MKKARQDIDRLLNRLFPVMLLSEFAILIPDKYSLLQLTLLSIWGISTVSQTVDKLTFDANKCARVSKFISIIYETNETFRRGKVTETLMFQSFRKIWGKIVQWTILGPSLEMRKRGGSNLRFGIPKEVAIVC